MILRDGRFRLLAGGIAMVTLSAVFLAGPARDSMGVSTGIDLERLFEAREILIRGIPDEPVYGHTPLAGLPKGFSAHA